MGCDDPLPTRSLRRENLTPRSRLPTLLRKIYLPHAPGSRLPPAWAIAGAVRENQRIHGVRVEWHLLEQPIGSAIRLPRCAVNQLQGRWLEQIGLSQCHSNLTTFLSVGVATLPQLASLGAGGCASCGHEMQPMAMDVRPRVRLRCRMAFQSTSPADGCPSATRMFNQHVSSSDTGRDRKGARIRRAARAGCASLLLLASALALAQSSGGSYAISRQVIGGGGARATGGVYVLVGTAAQATAGSTDTATLRLTSGFHAPASEPLPAAIFRSGFEN